MMLILQLSKVYDVTDPFEPSIAEVTMIHMLFAIMYFQYASRNWQNAGQQSGLNDLSNRHYHYALSFFPQLVARYVKCEVTDFFLAMSALTDSCWSFP